MLRLAARAAAALGLLAVVLLPGPPGIAQVSGTPAYTYYMARGQADGLTTNVTVDGLLPVDELVGLSSITAESHLTVGRSDSLAVLPNPGDLVLSLPGTLAALTGVAGLPDYPAAARAEDPSAPTDDVQLAPDAGLGALHLHADASEDSSAASAAITAFHDTIGLLPSFSIGSVQTTSTTKRPDPATFEADATTTVSNVRLLGSLVQIDQITSVSSAKVLGDKLVADASEVTVTGASIAGQPVGITADGITALNQSQALAPTIDALAKPLQASGLQLHTTPRSESVHDGTATAVGGTLALELPVVVQGRPGTVTLTLGQATAEGRPARLRQAPREPRPQPDPAGVRSRRRLPASARSPQGARWRRCPPARRVPRPPRSRRGGS